MPLELLARLRSWRDSERLRFIVEAMVLGAQSNPNIRNAVAMSREHLRLADVPQPSRDCSLEARTPHTPDDEAIQEPRSGVGSRAKSVGLSPVQRLKAL